MLAVKSDPVKGAVKAAKLTLHSPSFQDSNRKRRGDAIPRKEIYRTLAAMSGE